MNNRQLLIIVGLLVVLFLALCGFVAFYFFFWSATSEPEADDSWSQIQAAGKIVVGTSADYPPFEYYVGDFQVDGFDIALMNEIGRRLGLQVEYRNFAFDGLGSALQLNQIDAAIAAISITPDREAAVDFSNVYYVTEDAILTHERQQVTITQPQDLQGLRIGVQSGSVHEQWAQRHLVEPGLTQPKDLYVYRQVDQALNDLRSARLDFVVMDLPPAQVAVQEGGLVIAGQGLDQQRFALAFSKGATSLKTEIDRVLAELHSEGKIAELAQQYLKVDELLPTPTPTPSPGPDVTATPVPTPVVCVDGLALVEHLNLDDQNMSAPPEMQPGQPFNEGWRVRNVGTCPWTTDYKVVYAHGNDPAAQMGGEPVPITREVPPGETYDIQVNLIAPLKPGVFQAFWQMENGLNTAFGERLPVGIVVPAPPTATPAPTSTPAPDVIFTVDRTNIKQGECVTFYWKVENVREIYFYPQGADWRKYGVTGEESRTECPPVTTTYELRVVNTNGSVDTHQITIYVEPVVGAPFISRFTVDPHPQITVGQCVEIRWEVQGEVDKVKISANNTSLWDGAPTTGSLQNCPPGTGTIEYAMEATGPGGSSRQQRTIKVVDAATATPIPTPAPEEPIITAFDINPNQIQVGQCVNVAWQTSGGTSRVVIKQDGNVVLDNASLQGAVQDCNFNQPGISVIRLEAYNSAGQSVYQEETVTVTDSQPDNPLAGTDWILEGTIDGTNVTASFGPDGSLDGSAGCNSYSAQYTASGRSLAITPPSSTGQLCGEPDGIMEQEDTYLNALSQVGGYKAQGNQLTLMDASGNTMMTFSQLVATPF